VNCEWVKMWKESVAKLFKTLPGIDLEMLNKTMKSSEQRVTLSIFKPDTSR